MSPETELSDADYEACKGLARHILFHRDRTCPQNDPTQTIQEELTQRFAREYAHVGIEDEPTDTRAATTEALVRYYTDAQWRMFWLEEMRKKGYSESALRSTRAQLRAALTQCYQKENAAASGAIEKIFADFKAAIEIIDFRASGRAIDALNPLLMKVIGSWEKQGFSTTDFDLL